MASNQEGPDFRMSLTTMRIIVFALVMGITSFAVVALIIRESGQGQGNQAPPLLTYLSLFFALMMVPLAFLIPSLMVKASRRQLQSGNPTNDETNLWGLYQTRLIVGAALLEGPAFFLLIAYLQEGHALTLLLAGIFALAILVKFPTQEGVDRWVTEQMEYLEQERKNL